MFGGDVEDREPHAAGDVDADGVGDHRVVRRQHPADRQAITQVGIGHERGGNGDRQAHGGLQLVDSGGFQSLAPDAVRGGVGPLDVGRALGLIAQGPGDLGQLRVGGVCDGVGQDGFERALQRVGVQRPRRLGDYPQRHADHRSWLVPHRDQSFCIQGWGLYSHHA